MLLDNSANRKRQGNGFNPLYYREYPHQNLFRDDAVGLNFEHIFNGVAADREIAMFTPRKDPCDLQQISAGGALMRWPPEGSSWGVDCTTEYTLSGSKAIDIVFSATPRENRFGQGYLAFMWAAYMNRARDRRIYFRGNDGGWERWMAFGEDLADGFETGTLSAYGVTDLPFEKDAQTLNLVEHPTKHFTRPFYYGLLDGDHDPATTDDTLAYIVMFDQADSVRFALWNFITDTAGKPDTHSPAWDWQYVIRSPRVGETYRYRARIMVKPFRGPEDVLLEYETWAASI